MKLIEQKCQPCHGGTQPMSMDEITSHMKELREWGTDGSRISKKFKFKDFKEAMVFVNKIADIAESEDHHPDIHVSYNKVEIILWTHAGNGLSINDFILAAKIDAI